MDFEIWRDNIVESAETLADPEYQALAWSGRIKTSDISPSEMIMTLMDDWAFRAFVAENADRLDARQAAAAGALLQAIDDLAPNYWKSPPSEIAASDVWARIVSASRELYLALRPQADAE